MKILMDRHGERHSRESGNPGVERGFWMLACAGMFMSLQLVLDHENEPGGPFFGGMTGNDPEN